MTRIRMFTQQSEGDPLPEAAEYELFAATVQMVRTGSRQFEWTPRDNSVPLLALSVEIVGKEERSFAGLDGGPVFQALYRTAEGGSGSMTFIVPRRILRGYFPDELHELIATVMTSGDDYVN